MNYGYTIKTLRVEKMKQRQNVFAQCVGISQTYLSQIESGSKKPSTDLLEKIATHVGIPMPVLFWNTLREEDVDESKRDAYRTLKPSVDALIQSFFFGKEDRQEI